MSPENLEAPGVRCTVSPSWCSPDRSTTPAASIRLRVTPGGFGTVAVPDLRVEGLELVSAERRGCRSVGTFAGLARAAGVDAREHCGTCTPTVPASSRTTRSQVDPDAVGPDPRGVRPR